MTVYRTSSTAADERIRAARATCLERDRLVALRASLGAEQARAAGRVHALAREVHAEASDVARYQGGVWAFLYDLFADREARLTKEQQEACAAQLRFDDESASHDRLVVELADLDGRLAAMAEVDVELATARAAKLGEAKAAGGQLAERLEEIATDAAITHAARIAVDEAMVAGTRVLANLEVLAATLESARGWGSVDLFLNSGLVSMAKRGKIDEARGRSGVVQAELFIFQRELGDVGLRLDAHLATVSSEGRFLDVFFDNLFTDLAVQDRIKHAQASTAHVIGTVRQQLLSLHTRRDALAKHAHDLAAWEHQLTEPV